MSPTISLCTKAKVGFLNAFFEFSCFIFERHSHHETTIVENNGCWWGFCRVFRLEQNYRAYSEVISAMAFARSDVNASASICQRQLPLATPGTLMRALLPKSR